MAPTFHHITFQTGDNTAASRADIREEMVRHLKPIVQNGGGTLADVRFDVIDRRNTTDVIFDIRVPHFGRLVRAWFSWQDPAGMQRRLGRDLGPEGAGMVPADTPFLLTWIDEAVPGRVDATQMPALGQALYAAADAQRCFAWAAVAAGEETTSSRAETNKASGGRLTLAVGQRSPFPAPPGESLKVAFDRKRAPLLLLGTDKPTANEVKGVRKDPLHVGLLPHGRHTAFLLLRGPRIAADWMDAPFSAAKLPPHLRGLPACGTGQGYLARLLMIDIRDNRIKAMRQVSFSPAFSQALQSEVARQSETAAAFSEAAHDAEIRQAYHRLPRGTDMIRHATITEQAGRADGFGGHA